MAVQCLSSIKERSVKWRGEFKDHEGNWTYPQGRLDDPITLYKSNSLYGLNEVMNHFSEFDADLLFTHYDTWLEQPRTLFSQVDIPYSSYIIVDHYPAPEAVIEQIMNAHKTIAMSEYAKIALRQKGVISTKIPHGVDTNIYQPLSEKDKASEIEVGLDGDTTKRLDVDDHFIFGMVAANMGDRKNIPNHLEAFKMFLEEVDDSALMYIHTQQNANEGYNLYEVQKELDIPDKNVIWGHGEEYGKVGDDVLNQWYNAFDVLVNCSYGESWGLALTESMAAGTPVICSAYSAMPEQLGIEYGRGITVDDMQNIESISANTSGRKCYAGVTKGMDELYRGPHGVMVPPSVSVWRERVSSKLQVVHPRDIFNAMVYYYNNPDTIESDGEKARDFVVENYDWENAVVPAFKNAFDEIEQIITRY